MFQVPLGLVYSTGQNKTKIWQTWKKAKLKNGTISGETATSVCNITSTKKLLTKQEKIQVFTQTSLHAWYNSRICTAHLCLDASYLCLVNKTKTIKNVPGVTSDAVSPFADLSFKLDCRLFPFGLGPKKWHMLLHVSVSCREETPVLFVGVAPPTETNQTTNDSNYK
jgi:hypothetical protein